MERQAADLMHIVNNLVQPTYVNFRSAKSINSPKKEKLDWYSIKFNRQRVFTKLVLSHYVKNSSQEHLFQSKNLYIE